MGPPVRDDDAPGSYGPRETFPPPILRYFATGHLPPAQAAVSLRFGELAQWVADELAPGAEQSTALRKLLEGKDAAVRASLETSP